MNSKPAVNWGANCHRTWAWFHFLCFSVIKATHCWTEPCNVTAIILVSAAELFHQTWRELHSTCFWVCRSEMLVQISNILKHPLPLSAAKIDQSSGITERGSLSYTLHAWIRDTQTGSVIHIRQAGPKRSEMDILWHHEDFCRFIVHIGTVSDVCVICSHVSGPHNEQALEESPFILRSIQVSYFLQTRSTIMSDVSIRAPRRNTHLPRRLHVIRDGELANPPSLLSARVKGSRSSISPSLWLKWGIECVCAAQWEAHYNALACCWK